MTARRYTLPLTGLALTTTAGVAGCTPGIVGEWELVEIEVNGDDFAELIEGYSGTEEYNGCTYSYFYGVTISFEFEQAKGGEIEGDWIITYNESYSNSCEPEENYSESYSESYEAEVQAEGNNNWTIEVDEYDGELSCTVTDDEMQCEGDFADSDTVMVFERQ